MAKKKYIWLGNNVAAGLKADGEAEPTPIGGEITLGEAQVATLEKAGHRFADPESREGKDAAKQAAATGTDDPSQDPPK